MAQVTMNGIEYRNMIKMEDQREELLNIFVKAQQVTFTEDNISQYGAGTFSEIKYPAWVEETLISAMEAQLIMKDYDELALWFKSECFYFSCLTREFSRHSWHNGVNMLDYSEKLREYYEEWKRGQSGIALDEEEVDEDEF